jgi:hypothetical protein
MFIFLAGMALGGLLAAGGGLALAYRLAGEKLNNISNDVTTTAEKLVQARKRFGQIANRESIGEARKIANIALKELEK